jgi:hypothetical protein
MYLDRVWKVLVLLLTAVSDGSGYVQWMHEEDCNTLRVNEKFGENGLQES